MSAHKMAIACGVAALAMGTVKHALAFDDRPMPAQLDARHNADSKAGRPMFTVALDNDRDRRTDETGPSGRAAPHSLFDEARHLTQQSGFASAPLDQLPALAPRGTEAKRKKEPSKSAFLPYAGIGFGKVKLSMDFDDSRVKLKKDRGYSEPRIILGMGYTLSEHLSLGMEYRAIAGEQQMFSPNTYTGLPDHSVILKAKYRF